MEQTMEIPSQIWNRNNKAQSFTENVFGMDIVMFSLYNVDYDRQQLMA